MNEEEEPPQGSKTAGAAVLTVAALGVGVAVYAYSRDLLVIGVWAVGAWLFWRTVKKMPRAANPAPPAPSERGSEKKQQVTMVRDTAHPNRWLVTRESPWMTEEIDKEAGTT